MSRRITRFWAWFFILCTALSGCHPLQPYYLNEDGDLSHLVEQSMDIDYADVDAEPLPDAEYSSSPRTLTDPKFESMWELPLEEAVAIALQNSKVLRTFSGGIERGGLGTITNLAPDRLISAHGSAPTIYDPSIRETDPTTGPIAALSAFDAQFNSDLSWGKTDRPRNARPFAGLVTNVVDMDNGEGNFAITKRSMIGSEFHISSGTTYSAGTQNFAIPSDWLQEFEVGFSQALLRGAGVQVNRANVLIARMNTDISLAQFEQSVRNTVSDTIRAYWELYFNYRQLEAAKVGRDSALITWKRVYALYKHGGPGGEAEKEAQAREQYFAFRSAVETSLKDLYAAETRLRYMLGLTATDGRLIRPSDEPTVAKVNFDWCTILAETLTRSPELREQMWRIKQEEVGLITARNQLLPQLDLTANYRWVGMGDDLITADRRGLDFPADGSTAFDELTGGRYQEYDLGLRMSMPIGFRKEHARVQNVKLQIARSKALLEDMELEMSHLLTSAVQDLDANYVLAQTNFNRHVAAKRQVDAVQTAYEIGTITLDVLLEAQRRRAEAEVAYYRALVEYNLAIIQIHFRKGSLLETCNIELAEGPWPAKAYFDALNRARRRDASYYMNYGYTRPEVISQGKYEQFMGETDVYDADTDTTEVIDTPEPTPAEPAPAEEEPVAGVAPRPLPMQGTSGTAREASGPKLGSPGIFSQTTQNYSSLGSEKTTPKVGNEKTAQKGSFAWGDFRVKSNAANITGTNNHDSVRQASHESSGEAQTSDESAESTTTP